jgi:hypothetical protein
MTTMTTTGKSPLRPPAEIFKGKLSHKFDCQNAQIGGASRVSCEEPWPERTKRDGRTDPIDMNLSMGPWDASRMGTRLVSNTHRD